MRRQIKISAQWGKTALSASLRFGRTKVSAIFLCLLLNDNFPFCGFERQYKRHLADGVDFVRRYALIFLQRAFFILFFAFYYGSFVSANVKNVSV